MTVGDCGAGPGSKELRGDGWEEEDNGGEGGRGQREIFKQI